MAQWMVANKKADFKAIGSRFGIDQVTARILRNRNLTDDEQIRLFLSGTVEDLYDPHLFKDGDKLADILAEKLKTGASIRIIGDYDIDGVMSTYILYHGMQCVLHNGALAMRERSALASEQAICLQQTTEDGEHVNPCGTKVSVAIPNRITDGYGLNIHLIEEALRDGVDTIITCDNGIAAIDEIAYAKEHGMTVLVTDHHEIPFEEREGQKIYQNSRADAVVNPHQADCGYPYKDLCGAAVAWKMIVLLYEKCQVPVQKAEELLENVAFATVGDIMPLTGENRILVKEGLRRIHHTDNIGMRALIAQCGLTPEQIGCYHFGFVLGPCINAAGRLDTARRALELFLTDDSDQAAVIANELVVLNTERKAMTADGVEEAKRLVESGMYANDPVLVLFLPSAHESIAGIIAGRVRELYYRPTFILTKAEDGVKGSGRSIEAYSMYEELCRCKDLLTRFGGHPMAAGVSLPEENVDEFRKRLNEQCSLRAEQMEETVHIDVPMPVDYVTMELVQEFDLLEPFGKDNPRPLFADRNLSVSRMWIIGKNQNVLRLSLVSEHKTMVSGIYFGDIGKLLDEITDRYGSGELQCAMEGKENSIRLSIVYSPQINEYRGTSSLQYEIKYFRV